MKDERIAYGAICTWWDSIDKVGSKGPSSFGGKIPCCPFCKQVLFEMPNEADWYAAVDSHDAKEPGYRKFMEWQRGKCHRNYEAARKAYSVAMQGMTS